MTHTLEFANDDLGKKRFEYIFRGLIVIGNQNSTKGLSVLSREITILDKLEAISKPCECGKLVMGSNEPDRELSFSGEDPLLVITLDDSEIDLLYDYISRVPWSIGDSSRNALKTLVWLKS